MPSRRAWIESMEGSPFCTFSPHFSLYRMSHVKAWNSPCGSNRWQANSCSKKQSFSSLCSRCSWTILHKLTRLHRPLHLDMLTLDDEDTNELRRSRHEGKGFHGRRSQCAFIPGCQWSSIGNAKTAGTESKSVEDHQEHQGRQDLAQTRPGNDDSGVVPAAKGIFSTSTSGTDLSSSRTEERVSKVNDPCLPSPFTGRTVRTVRTRPGISANVRLAGQWTKPPRSSSVRQNSLIACRLCFRRN